MNILERLKKGTSKLTITKLSYNAPAYVRAREQEIELMGIIEQQSKQIEQMKCCENCEHEFVANYKEPCDSCNNFEKWQWDGGSGE